MKVLAVTSRSATFELETGRSPYFSCGKFFVKINGYTVREECRNVFSVFSLEPDTSYVLEAGNETAEFKTSAECYCFDVKDFNAFGDGVHDDTPAFNTAIACLPKNGTLYIPQGTYSLKPVFLKSDMTLYLERGAILIGSADRNDYPVLKGNIGGINLGTWQGEEADCFASLITAIGQSNISIIGEGTVDCNAHAGDWYIDHRVKRTAWRPRGIFLNNCRNVLIQGISVKDTPSWNIHPYFCKDVKLYDLYLKNNPSMPTTDGIDPDCCDGVEIAGVKISVGDDCIAIKSGTLELAKKYKTPCKNITVRNCLMREGHGGIVFGSELSGGIENITVTRCLFDGTDRGLRIKTRRGRGRIGKCDGVKFSDIVMKDVKVPFVINMYYNMGDETGHTEYVWTTEKLPVDERTPEIGEFVFENIDCTGVEYCAVAFYGLPESPIVSVTFTNVSFRYKSDAKSGFPDMREKNVAVRKQGLDFHYVNSLTLNNVHIEGQEGKEYNINEVKNFEII